MSETLRGTFLRFVHAQHARCRFLLVTQNKKARRAPIFFFSLIFLLLLLEARNGRNVRNEFPAVRPHVPGLQDYTSLVED